MAEAVVLTDTLIIQPPDAYYPVLANLCVTHGVGAVVVVTSAADVARVLAEHMPKCVVLDNFVGFKSKEFCWMDRHKGAVYGEDADGRPMCLSGISGDDMGLMIARHARSPGSRLKALIVNVPGFKDWTEKLQVFCCAQRGPAGATGTIEFAFYWPREFVDVKTLAAMVRLHVFLRFACLFHGSIT